MRTACFGLLFLLVLDGFAPGLDLGLLAGDGGAQLVGGIRNKAPLGFCLPVQQAKQPVEGAHDGAHFHGCAALVNTAKVTRRAPLDCQRQIAQWPQRLLHGPADKKGHDRNHDQIGQ